MSTMLGRRSTLLAFCLLSSLPLSALPEWISGAGRYFGEMFINSAKTTVQGLEFFGKEIAVSTLQESAKNALRNRLETTPVTLPGYQTMLEVDNELYDEVLLKILKVYIVRHYKTLNEAPGSILIKIRPLSDTNEIINTVKEDLKSRGHNSNDFMRRFSVYMDRYYHKFAQEEFQDTWNRKKTLLIWATNQGVGATSRYIVELLRNVIASLATKGLALGVRGTLADAQGQTKFIDPVTGKLTTMGLMTTQSFTESIFAMAEDLATSNSGKLTVGIFGCFAQLYLAAAQFAPHDTEFLTDLMILYQVGKVLSKTKQLQEELFGKSPETASDIKDDEDDAAAAQEAQDSSRRPLNTYPKLA